MASWLFPNVVRRKVSDPGEYTTLSSKIPRVVSRNEDSGNRPTAAIIGSSEDDKQDSKCPNNQAGMVHCLNTLAIP